MTKIRHLKSTTIIFLGFFVVLASLTALMLVWANSISKNNDRMEKITQQLVETQHVFSMRDAAYQRAIILYRMVGIDDPFERNDEYMAFKELANNFISARDKFQRNENEDREHELIWSRAKPMINLNAKLQNDTAELILEDRVGEAQKRLIDQVKPVQDVVMAELTKLFEVERVNAVRKLDQAKKENHLIFWVITTVSAVVLVVGAFIAWFVARRTRESESYLLDQTEKIRELYALSGNSGLSFNDQMDATLRLGCRLFNLEIGKVCHLDTVENTNTFLYTVAPEDFNVFAGTKVPMEQTFCNIVFELGKPVAMHDVRNSEFIKHPCYEFSHLESYIAAPIYINGAKYGTVNFSSRKPRKEPFSESDRELINLVGNWVSVALEREIVQKELKQAKDAAELANRAKSGFLANMSHEIRTPLTAILGFSETLLDQEQNPTQQRTAVSSIIRSGRLLQQIINDILDLSKIEAEQLELEKIEVSPFQILSDVDKVVGVAAREKGLKFEIFYEFPIPKMILTDPTRLKQILINICHNASKFTEQGSVIVELRYLSENRQLMFTITDTGIGMTQDEIKNIFNAFTQADNSTIRKYGGTGLGLCISRQLANKLGGNITCFSEKGKGSQFVVTLSTGIDEEAELVNEYNKAEFSQPPVRSLVPDSLRGRVLLAEDSPDNQQLISMYIRKTGASVTVAENGKIAVNHVMAEDFDLVLMDMQMPVMGGLEAIQWLRQIGCTVPVVALTANAMKQDRDRCIAAGADDYITKPVDLGRFYSVLQTYLRHTDEGQNPDAGKRHALLSDELANDPEFLELVDDFVCGLPAQVDSIVNAAELQNWEVVESLSHNLKGVGGNYGFPRISEISEKINMDMKNNSYDRIQMLVNELDSECNRIVSSNQSRRAS